jgi:hypothetical protein
MAQKLLSTPGTLFYLVTMPQPAVRFALQKDVVDI